MANSDVVAQHYNSRAPNDLRTRSQSNIYYLRNFNNWIKSVLIGEFTKKLTDGNKHKKLAVLDLGCGKGGDILKWKKASVSRVTFVDIAAVSLDECKRRNVEPSRSEFATEFIHMDATRIRLKDVISSEDKLQHDLVSSQFVIHYSFESYEQADTFMRNVSESLNVGGYFVGTTTNAHELVKRLRESDTCSFGNNIYNINFLVEDKEEALKKDIFGVKFDFQLEGVVECPEFLLNFEALIMIARRHKLEIVFKKTFDEMFNEYSAHNDYNHLLVVMKALEPYFNQYGPFDSSKLQSSEYATINEMLKEESPNDLYRDEAYATLSNSEWEVARLYLAFAFIKV